MVSAITAVSRRRYGYSHERRRAGAGPLHRWHAAQRLDPVRPDGRPAARTTATSASCSTCGRPGRCATRSAPAASGSPTARSGWRSATEAFGGWDQVDVDRVLGAAGRLDTTSAVRCIGRRLIDRAQSRPSLTEYLDIWTRLYAAISAVSGAAESSSTPPSAPRPPSCCSAAPGIDLRIAHVVRDPRGVVNSWNKKVALPANAGPRDHLKTPTRHARSCGAGSP